MVEKAEALVRDNTFLEFRLDYLAAPASGASPASSNSPNTIPMWPPSPLAAAWPTEASSGDRWPPKLTFSTKAAAAGCQLVDMELQSAAACKRPQLERLRTRAALILSYHDFRGTKKLEETLEKMVALPADFYKIVTTATTLHDNV